MDNDDWFRSSAWDYEAKQLFRKKLTRARDHKFFYLKTKASSIAAKHPFEAIKLFDEYIAADSAHFFGGNYSKSLVYLTLDDIDAAIEFLSLAIGKSGMNMGAPALLEFTFLVGLHKRSEYYQRVLEWLLTLDEQAQKSLGRPFNRNFAGSAGAAFILYELGKAEDAKHQAKAALKLSLAEKGPIAKYPQLGRIPSLPKALMDRLIIVAEIWDESELGPRPAIQ